MLETPLIIRCAIIAQPTECKTTFFERKPSQIAFQMWNSKWGKIELRSGKTSTVLKSNGYCLTSAYRLTILKKVLCVSKASVNQCLLIALQDCQNVKVEKKLNIITVTK